MKNFSKYILYIVILILILAFFVFMKDGQSVHYDEAFSQELDKLLHNASKQIQIGKTKIVVIEKPCEADHCIMLCAYYNFDDTIESDKDANIEYLTSRKVPPELAEKISSWRGGEGISLIFVKDNELVSRAKVRNARLGDSAYYSALSKDKLSLSIQLDTYLTKRIINDPNHIITLDNNTETSLKDYLENSQYSKPIEVIKIE